MDTPTETIPKPLETFRSKVITINVVHWICAQCKNEAIITAQPMVTAYNQGSTLGADCPTCKARGVIKRNLIEIVTGNIGLNRQARRIVDARR